jgi:hypothetical protein
VPVRKKYAHIRRYQNHQLIGLTSLDLSTLKHRPTVGLQLSGFLLTLCASLTGFWGGFLAWALLYHLLQPFLLFLPPEVAGVTGLVLGLVCMGAASPLLRRCAHALKRAYLREAGIIGEATVVGYRHHVYRGPEQFDLIVTWQHPASGQTYTYERRYTFFWELFNSQKDELFHSYYAGAYLQVWFNPDKPQHFILDIPFIPCWFDLLF